MARPVQFSWKQVWRNPALIGPFAASWRGARKLFGRFFTATILYRMLHQADAAAVAESFVLQDAYMPTAGNNVTALLEYVRAEIPLTVPIWLCPVKPPAHPQPLSPSGGGGGGGQTTMLMNVAVWGRVSDRRAIHYTRQLEEKMVALGGRKMLYSLSLSMTAEELYATHIDGAAHQRLRHVYGAEGVFAPLHEKLQLLNATDDNYYVVAMTKSRGLKYWLSRFLL